MARRRGEGEVAPNFLGADLFTLKFICGGQMIYFDNVDPDLLSTHELKYMMEEVGYKNVKRFHFTKPGEDPQCALHPLDGDNDISAMINIIPSSREMTIYVEHDADKSILVPEPNFNDFFHAIMGDASTQVPEKVFSHIQSNAQVQDEVLNSLWSTEIPNPNVDKGKRVYGNVLEESGEQYEVNSEGLYETFLQEDGEIGYRCNHGTNSDDSDYELYDSENDAAMEDDDLLFAKYVDISSVRTNTRPVVERTVTPKNIIDNELPEEKEHNFEELHSPHNSDDDEDSTERDPEFNAETDMDKPSFKIRMRFAQAKHLKTAIKRYSIYGGYDIDMKKNDRGRVTAVCAVGCPWRLHASVMQNDTTWQIKVLNDKHICSRVWKNKYVTYKFIAEKYLNRFKDHPGMTAKTLQDVIKRDMELDVGISQCFRARTEALQVLRGSYDEQYAKIWEYCEEVRQTNVGSTMKVSVDPPFFKRLYVCLDACKKGFKAGCRPVIGVDGCHLKGPYEGQLLAAVGIDANDNMFPIAYAAVEIENKETWSWFLQLLIDDLGPVEEHGWTFISDQQKGLDVAFKQVVPRADHRWCVRHLYGNFKAIHKGKTLKDLLWSAARAPNRVEFETEMEKLKSVNDKAYNWLAARDPIRWARSRFSTRVKCDMLLNNLCETFNSWILTARDKPILTMMEMIKCNLMRRLQAKKTEMSTWPRRICPKIQTKLNKARFSGRNYLAAHAGNLVFQVGTYLNDQYVVDVGNRTCSCRSWDLTGIPCIHACAALFHHRADPEEYVDEVYTKETYLRAYDYMIFPVKGNNMWPKSTNTPLLPPLVKKQPGRPKRVRRKDPEMEKKVVDPNNKQLASRKGKTIRCSKCWQWGHHWNFCKNEPTDVPPGVYVDKRYMYPRPHTEVRKGKKASANPVEVVVDSGNATGNYHAYGHETPTATQAPTMAKQPAIRHTHVETTRATSQFKMATATTEGLIGDIPYQSAGNSALVHTRTKCKRKTTVETVGSSAPLVVLPSVISSNSNFANAPWRPPGMTSAISSNAKNPWRPSGMSPMHNMQNQQVKKHRTLQKK